MPLILLPYPTHRGKVIPRVVRCAGLQCPIKHHKELQQPVPLLTPTHLGKVVPQVVRCAGLQGPPVPHHGLNGVRAVCTCNGCVSVLVKVQFAPAINGS
eukprot:1162142-Pelagomonas_calceolata.AAC.13